MNKIEKQYIETYQRIHSSLHFCISDAGIILTSQDGSIWTPCGKDFLNGALAASNGLQTLKVEGKFKWLKRIYRKFRRN